MKDNELLAWWLGRHYKYFQWSPYPHPKYRLEVVQLIEDIKASNEWCGALLEKILDARKYQTAGFLTRDAFMRKMLLIGWRNAVVSEALFIAKEQFDADR